MSESWMPTSRPAPPMAGENPLTVGVQEREEDLFASRAWAGDCQELSAGPGTGVFYPVR
jgi:hypothetical protein